MSAGSIPLMEFASLLPDPDGSDEERCRAVLRLILAGASGTRVEPDATTCPNCGVLVGSTKSPYCGERCREVSSFVRQFRAGLAKGVLRDPEKQLAMGQVLWHLIGGGRPLRLTLVPEKAVLRVLERERHVCQVCGGAATTVDHIATGCNRPINLRAVCEACMVARPCGSEENLAKPGAQELLAEISARVTSAEPLRICDDQETWDWREYLRQRAHR